MRSSSSGQTPLYGKLKSLPEHFDGAWICSAVEERPAYIKQCVERGPRLIFCEPPVALTTAEVAQCYSLCHAHDVELLCAWPHRFDPQCRALYDKTRDLRITSALLKHHDVSRTGARPSSEDDDFQQQQQQQQQEQQDEKGTGAGAAGEEEHVSEATFIHKLLAEDFNEALFFMDEQIPLSIQATCRDTYGSGSPDTAIAHLEYPCGVNVMIEASVLGGSRFESSAQIVVEGRRTLTAGKTGVWGCRADRFDRAIRAEAEYFAQIVGGAAVERVCKEQHCRMTERLLDMAVESAQMGRKVLVNPSMHMLQIGCGTYGRRVQQDVLPRLPNCETVAVLTADNSELELDSAIGRKDIDAVYVCTPYAHTSALVQRALNHGGRKRILSEVPLPRFNEIQLQAIAQDKFLMLAYRERFDTEFKKAKAFVEELGVFSSLAVDSRDVDIDDCERTTGLDPVKALYKYVSSDLDAVAWMLEDIDCEISVSALKSYPSSSSITVVVDIWLRTYDRTVQAVISHGRGSPVYRRQVTVNGRVFGYEIPATENWRDIFNDATVRMFQFFANQNPTPGQGKFCQTYAQTHQLLMDAIDIATDEKDTDENSALIPHPLTPPTSSAATATATATAQERQKCSCGCDAQTEPAYPVVEEFRHAVASHGGLFTSGSRFFKPTQVEGTEFRVYNLMKEREPQLVRFVPEMIDQIMVNDTPYLVMRNVVHGYAKPHVLNVKVGEPSDFQKMCYQPYGIRIAGYTGDSGIRRCVPQSWNDMVAYFKSFIKDKETNTSRYDNIPYWLMILRDLQVAMAQQKTFRFHTSSLLFVYDAVDDAPQKPMLYLIHMSHTTINGSGSSSSVASSMGAVPRYDHFFSFGLKNLERVLEEIHSKFVNRHAVFLCRHGFRVDYGDLTWVGNSPYPHDPPLSKEGLSQARDLAKRLRFENISCIVTSPFTRAVQTAKAIAEELGIKYVVEPAFAEFMSVANRKNIPALDPQYSQDELRDERYVKSCDSLTLENWDSMCIRVHEALWKLSKSYNRIAIVSHRSTFQALLSVILGSQFKNQLQFASITSLLPSPSEVGWKIDHLNSYSHLSAILKSPDHNPNYAAGTLAYKDMITGADGKILPSGYN